MVPLVLSSCLDKVFDRHGLIFRNVNFQEMAEFYRSVGLNLRKIPNKRYAYYLLTSANMGLSGCTLTYDTPSTELMLLDKSGKAKLDRKPITLLGDMFTAEFARGKGYGTKLLESVLLKENFDKDIWLEVAKDNDTAKNLYERLGFETVNSASVMYDVMVRKVEPNSTLAATKISLAGNRPSDVKKNPEDWARKASIKDLADMVKQAKYFYYNSSKPILSDQEYEIVEDVLRERDPDNKELKIGAPVKEKVKLPISMGSLDKVKDEKALVSWLKKNPAKEYIISDKLDGVSFLIEGLADGSMKMYTRGDGTYGQDISTFIPSIKSIPRRKMPAGILLRGELIMSKSKFERVWSKTAANARNMVSGLVNRKDLHKALASVDAIIYSRLDKPSMPEKQFKLAKSLGFKIAPWKKVDRLDYNELVETLDTRKSKSRFDLDGIVIQTNKRHSVEAGNPSWAMAFKQNSESDMRIATVVEVHWQASRYGKLKPRVEIEPLSLKGVTITFVTGHNAEYIKDNNIGPGTEIKIVRSGDVIPYIVDVLNGTRAQMPEEDYVWDGVDVRVEQRTVEGELRQIEHFFVTMGVEGMRGGTVKKLADAGFDDVFSILDMETSEWREIVGKQAGAKIDKQIDSLYQSKQPITKLLFASGFFEGIGTSRFADLVDYNPDFMKVRNKGELEDVVSGAPGWGPGTVRKFVKNMGAFRKFLRETNIKWFVDGGGSVPATSSEMKGETVLFTGFRDTGLADRVMAAGGKMATGISRKVTLLVAADPNSSSSKMTKARSYGIRIITREELEDMLS